MQSKRMGSVQRAGAPELGKCNAERERLARQGSTVLRARGRSRTPTARVAVRRVQFEKASEPQPRQRIVNHKVCLPALFFWVAMNLSNRWKEQPGAASVTVEV